LLSTDVNQFDRNRRIDSFQRGDRKLIPAGQAHIRDQANFFLSGRFAQQLIGLVERRGQIGGAVGDLDGVEIP
jgi:hypothetical protein